MPVPAWVPGTPKPLLVTRSIHLPLVRCTCVLLSFQIGQELVNHALGTGIVLQSFVNNLACKLGSQCAHVGAERSQSRNALCFDLTVRLLGDTSCLIGCLGLQICEDLSTFATSFLTDAVCFGACFQKLGLV